VLAPHIVGYVRVRSYARVHLRLLRDAGEGRVLLLGCFVESDLSLLVDGVIVGGGVEEGLSSLPLLLRLVVRVLVDLFLGGGVLSGV
jgi:hypothetical protein